MIIKNKKLLKDCRSAGLCEYCLKSCKNREGAHIVSVGAGGSDISINLVRLGSTVNWCCQCHSNHHNGKAPTRGNLFQIVADREKCDTEDILLVIRFIQQLWKHASKYSITESLIALPEPARSIAKRELEEAGKI